MWQPSDLSGVFFNESGFGVSVLLQDGLLIGGAPNDGPAGSVHVLDLTTGVRRYKLTAGAGGADFGTSLAAGGGRLAVADYAAHFYAGRVSVYELASGQWIYDVFSPDLVSSDGFGISVAIDGDLLVVGASYHHHGGGPGSGAAYVFDAASGALLYELLGSPIATSVRYGGTLAVRDGIVAVGDAQDSRLTTYAGAAYQYSIPVRSGSTACVSAALNSSGQLGQLEALGCTAWAFDLSLRASALPPNQLGLFLASPTAGFSPMHQGGQGTLCLGAPMAIYRSQARSTGAAGTLELSLDLSSIPTAPSSAVAPGDTWYFQAWHRDLNPGPTSNLTSAQAVVFH